VKRSQEVPAMQGCICPHPPLLIPEVGGASLSRVSSTVQAMRRLANQVGEPDTIVVISPHSDGYPDAHVVRTAPRLSGDFGRFRCPEASFRYDNDVPFTELLLALAGDYRKLRLVPDDSEILDWGALVPLSFLKARQIVSLSIVSAYDKHPTLGQLVRRCAEELGRDTVFLASGDLSHALTHDAPAPYDPRGKLFDDEVVRLLGVGDFGSLGRMDPILLEGAAECGLRSFMALGGFLGDDAQVDPQILSYEGPFGVGYMVAHFGVPAGAREGFEA
jgi:MEMO1 family protein